MKRLIIKYPEDSVRDDEHERVYLDEFLEILTVDKVARMYIAEEDFRDKMIKMWKKPESGHDPEHNRKP